MWCVRRGSANEFLQAKRVGIAALTVGMLQWFIAFVCVGGEWFLMWQSPSWNGTEAALRLFIAEVIVLILLTMPEPAPGE